MLDDESPTSANLENDPMRAYAQSGQYHIIVESRVHLRDVSCRGGVRWIVSDRPFNIEFDYLYPIRILLKIYPNLVR